MWLVHQAQGGHTRLEDYFSRGARADLRASESPQQVLDHPRERGVRTP